MRKTLFTIALLLSQLASATTPERYPPPITDPAPRPTTPSPMATLPLTGQGGTDLIQISRQACMASNPVSYCVPIGDPQKFEYKVYSKTDGHYMFDLTRQNVEQVNAQTVQDRRNADGSYPEDRYLAKLDNYRRNLEYGEIVCSGVGSLCGVMAGKLGKYVQLFTAACAMSASSCAKEFRDEREKIKNEMERIKAACAKGDQQCMDAFSGGAETLTRAQEAAMKSGGEGPPDPRYPPGGWTPGRPVYVPGGIWYYGEHHGEVSISESTPEEDL